MVILEFYQPMCFETFPWWGLWSSIFGKFKLGYTLQIFLFLGKHQNPNENPTESEFPKVGWVSVFFKHLRNLESQLSKGNCSSTPQVHLPTEPEMELQGSSSNLKSRASSMGSLNTGHRVLTSIRPLHGRSPNTHWMRKEGTLTVISKTKQIIFFENSQRWEQEICPKSPNRV